MTNIKKTQLKKKTKNNFRCEIENKRQKNQILKISLFSVQTRYQVHRDRIHFQIRKPQICPLQRWYTTYCAMHDNLLRNVTAN